MLGLLIIRPTHDDYSGSAPLYKSDFQVKSARCWCWRVRLRKTFFALPLRRLRAVDLRLANNQTN